MNLSDEKLKCIVKYQMCLNEQHIWEIRKQGIFPRPICKYQFMIKTDILGLVFRIYELCTAKVTYFRVHISEYTPHVYEYHRGFVQTELWNMEFLKHIRTKQYLDLRQLQGITNIEVFRELCRDLEKEQQYDYDNSVRI